MMPVWARPHVAFRSLQQLQDDVLDVFPDVACFGQRGRILQSRRAHPSMRARVCASSVLPVPVGPISMMF